VEPRPSSLTLYNVKHVTDVFEHQKGKKKKYDLGVADYRKKIM
jgi:hypothetical protein